jgi:hypothetical protein
VTLGESTTLSATGSNAVIRLAAAVDSDSTSTPRALVINASGAAGRAVLGGAVGATAPLNTLAITASDIGVNGGAITTTTSQTYTGPVKLSADTTLTGVGVTLGGTVRSDGVARALTVNDSGTTMLAGAVGGSVAGEELSSFTTDAAGATAINGGSVRTSGAQTYGDAVTLGGQTTLTGVGITLGSTVKSDGTARSLTINDSATTTLAGAVGGSASGEELGSLTTDAAGTTAINGGSVRTSGAQTYGDAVTLGASTTLAGSTVTTQAYRQRRRGAGRWRRRHGQRALRTGRERYGGHQHRRDHHDRSAGVQRCRHPCYGHHTHRCRNHAGRCAQF